MGLMARLGMGWADLVGWSDGGSVALEVALARPELVRKLVLIGTAIDLSGLRPELRASLADFRPEWIPREMRELYDRLSPDGAEHFPVIFEKVLAMWRTESQHSLSDLAALPMPTLLLVGDDDDVTVEHAAAVRRTIPEAQLAVVPGTDHGVIFEKPDVVNRLLVDFLADEQVAKVFSGDAPPG